VSYAAVLEPLAAVAAVAAAVVAAAAADSLEGYALDAAVEPLLERPH
jgi:hypothetical protein